MGHREIQLLDSVEALHDAAAALVLAALHDAVRERDVFHLVLAGGSTPRALYQRLAASPDPAWQRAHFWWGDERCVSPSHEASNFRTAWEAWLSPLGLPSVRIHRIAGEQPPRAAASRYEYELLQAFRAGPRFDLVLLGLGEDGHTASLFPGTPQLGDPRLVIPVTDSPKPPPDRVTLGLAALNAAREVLFLVAGAGKAGPVARILGHGDRELPGAQVLPPDGRVIWLLDPAAATGLSGGLTEDSRR